MAIRIPVVPENSFNHEPHRYEKRNRFTSSRNTVVLTTESTFRVVVIELDDEQPRLNPLEPNLLVAVSVSEPEELFSRLDQGEGKKNTWARNRVVKLRHDLAKDVTFADHESAKSCQQSLIKELQEKGFSVNQQRQSWRIYVIKLEKEGGPDNWIYVGSTSKTPEERLQEHKDGKRNSKGPLFSRKVKKYGTVLLYDMFPEENIFLTSRSALKREKDYAKKLRKDVSKASTKLDFPVPFRPVITVSPARGDSGRLTVGPIPRKPVTVRLSRYEGLTSCLGGPFAEEVSVSSPA